MDNYCVIISLLDNIDAQWFYCASSIFYKLYTKAITSKLLQKWKKVLTNQLLKLCLQVIYFN